MRWMPRAWCDAPAFMTPVQFEAFVAESRELVRLRMQQVKDQHGVGTFSRYDVDLPTARIR